MNVTPRAARHLAKLTTPEDVLLSVCDLFGDRVAIASSLGPQTLVVVDMLHRVGRSVPVFFLDTGLLFPETYALRMRVQRKYNLDVRPVHPRRSLAEQAVDDGPELWRREPDRCCAQRKVEPLQRVLGGLDAWITGLRRDQGPTRADIESVQWDDKHGLVKVSPLAHWTRAEVWQYIFDHDVPYNPMLDRGYKSVGCLPCTRAVGEHEDERAGRWADTEKTECGLHLA